MNGSKQTKQILGILVIASIFCLHLPGKIVMGSSTVDDTKIERYYLDASNRTIEKTYLFYHERIVDLKITNEINSTSSVRIEVNNSASTIPPATNFEQSYTYPASQLTVMNQLKINLTLIESANATSGIIRFDVTNIESTLQIGLSTYATILMVITSFGPVLLASSIQKQAKKQR